MTDNDSKAPQTDPAEEMFPEGFSYENGTTDEIELEPDEPPKSGEWVDVHDVLANPTDEEIEAGNAMGEAIDPDDDDDNGVDGVPG